MAVFLKALALSQGELVASVVLDPSQERFAGGSVDLIFRTLNECAHPWALHPFAIMQGATALGLVVLREGPARPSWASADAITLHSFRISLPFQGRGHGTRALGLARQWVATERPEIRRLMLTVSAENSKADALYRRCGFHPTGVIFQGRVGRERVLSCAIHEGPTRSAGFNT
jgi:GNAT superfamily N-acetyltransferase